MPFLIRLLLYNLKMSLHFTDARMRICYLWMIWFWLVCTYKPIRKQFLGLVLLRNSARWIALKFGAKRTTGEVGQKEDKTCEKESVSASGLRQFLASKWQAEMPEKMPSDSKPACLPARWTTKAGSRR